MDTYDRHLAIELAVGRLVVLRDARFEVVTSQDLKLEILRRLAVGPYPTRVRRAAAYQLGLRKTKKEVA